MPSPRMVARRVRLASLVCFLRRFSKLTRFVGRDSHPDYVTKAGHVECASDLAAYRASQSSSRMVKRHRDLAASILSKRGGQAYNIIAVDHLKDMATRAVAADQVDTFGGYTSTRLELWDQVRLTALPLVFLLTREWRTDSTCRNLRAQNDDGQRWVITQA